MGPGSDLNHEGLNQEGLNDVTSLSSSVNSAKHAAKLDPIDLPGKSEIPDLEKTNTLASKDSQIVPKDQRKGFLSTFCLVPEYKDPRNYSLRTKYSVVGVVAMGATIGPMGTSIILPAIEDVSKELHTSGSIVNVSVGIYILALGIFPLWWSSISERHGRRPVYVVSFTLFLCFSIGLSLSPNIAALIIFRFLMGASSASVQSVGAGTIADLFEVQERGTAMGYFYMGPLLGPLFAPIVGGAVALKWGFRGTSWFLVIFAGVLLIFLVVCLPETLRKEDNRKALMDLLKKRHSLDAEEKIESDSLGLENDIESLQSADSDQLGNINNVEQLLSRISTNRSENQNAYDGSNAVLTRISTVDRKQAKKLEDAELRKLKSRILEGVHENTSWTHELYMLFVKPIRSLVFLRYPPITLMVCYSAVSFMGIYFVNMTVAYKYARAPYSFSTILVGLTYLAQSVPYMVASVFGGRWIDSLVKNFEKKHGYLAPEARISWNIGISVFALPASLLIIGWCFEKDNHWETPLVGMAIWGFASVMVIGATVTYIVDSLPGRGATGVALNNLFRQFFATIACFVNEPLIKALGTGVLFSIVAGVLAVVAVVFIVIKRRGSYWRETYDLQKLYDYVDNGI